MSGNFTEEGAPPEADAPGYDGEPLVQCCIAMVVFTTVAVCLRFLSRACSKPRRFWWDDWTALVAWIVLIPMLALEIDTTKHGMGRHIETVSEHNIEIYELELFVLELCYYCTLTAAKISALLFYVRVFRMSHTWFRWSIWVTAGLCISWCIAMIILQCLQRYPTDSMWTTTTPKWWISSDVIFYATTIPDVVFDLMILLIPMPFVYSLHASVKRKVGLAVAFACGYATLCLSITRVVTVVAQSTEAYYDATWLIWPSIIFVLEPSICLISICLPSQIHLIQWVSRKVRHGGWTSGNRSKKLSDTPSPG